MRIRYSVKDNEGKIIKQEMIYNEDKVINFYHKGFTFEVEVLK